MLPFLSNAFNDPANPWYYVIGVLFLLLIFGALVVYVLWSGKKNKAKEEKENVNEDEVAEQKEQAEQADDKVAAPAVEPTAEPEQSENKDSE